MKNKFFIILALIAFIATPAIAGKLTVGSSDNGQFTDLKILGAESSAVSGNEATLDIRQLNQSSSSGAIPVLILDQDDVDDSVLEVECTEGALNTCSCYSTTSSDKVGAIKVEIDNGTTTVTRWIQLFNDPD